MRHLLLAIVVVAIWGTNFVVMKEALSTFPPFLLAALRFVFAFLPAVFFIPRPRVPWWSLAVYGLLIGVGQFGVTFWAMQRDISPGLASLVIQLQVFFTIGLSVWLAGERLIGSQVLGLLLGAAGILVIAVNRGGDASLLGVALVTGSAASWAIGNIVSRRSGTTTPMLALGYIVWSSLYAALALIPLSLLLDGADDVLYSLQHAKAPAWAAVAWQSFGNALFGFGVWAWLIARYSAATVTPVALLVPVFGIGAASVWLGEPLQAWKIGAAVLVIGGLAMNTVWPWLRARRARA